MQPWVIDPMRIVFVSTILLICASCNTVEDSFWDPRKPPALDMTPPEGPPEYQQGWLDGCKSGLSTVNTNINQTLGSYQYHMDANLWQNELYSAMWKDAYNFCIYYMFSQFFMRH